MAGQLPEHLTIGTLKAFEKNDAFTYEKQQINSEIIYICNKGSKWARTNEVLILRCQQGTWIAFDSDVNADGKTLQCRQAVFRCRDGADMTEPGWHCWEINDIASPNDTGVSVDWQTEVWAETRVA